MRFTCWVPGATPAAVTARPGGGLGMGSQLPRDGRPKADRPLRDRTGLGSMNTAGIQHSLPLRRLPVDIPIGHTDRFFIGGQWVAPSSGATIDVIDSATEELFFA